MEFIKYPPNIVGDIVMRFRTPLRRFHRKALTSRMPEMSKRLSNHVHFLEIHQSVNIALIPDVAERHVFQQQWYERDL